MLIEVGVVTSGFGLLRSGSSSGPSSPNLNPNKEAILAIFSAVTYRGSGSGYFSNLTDRNLCAGTCPLVLASVPANRSEFGIFFYLNVTNNASSTERLANFSLSTGGANPDLFSFAVGCCFHDNYSEDVSVLDALPHTTTGLRGFVFTNEVIPYTSAGGYTVYFNSTSP